MGEPDDASSHAIDPGRTQCRPLWVLAAATALVAAGCGKGQGDRAALYPAEGRVLWNGMPLGGAQIVLYPQGPSDAGALPARARASADGRFRVGTFHLDDGAAEGEYAVTVMHYPLQRQGEGWTPGPNVLPAKYASPKTTDLRVRIAKGDNTLPPLLLKR